MHKILNKRERIILVSALAVIILSVIFNYLFEPFILKNAILNKEIYATKAKFRKYLLLLQQKDNILSRYNKPNFSSGSAAGEKDPLVRALAELENLSKASNIRILDLRPQNPKKLDRYKEVIIEMRTEGNMEGYLKFIYSLESSFTMLKIKKFHLNAKPNSSFLEGIFSISQLSVE